MPWHDAVRVITDLGDSAVILPAAALLLLYLLHRKARRGAAIFATALVLCAALTFALKLGFRTCGGPTPLLDIRSPSGHTSLSTTFYNCSALLMVGGREGWMRVGVLMASALLVAAIAVSRILVEAHTGTEVITGLLVGTGCVAWFGWRYFDGPAASLPWQPPVLAFLVSAVLMHGWQLNLEGVIAALGNLIHTRLPICS